MLGGDHTRIGDDEETAVRPHRIATLISTAVLAVGTVVSVPSAAAERSASTSSCKPLVWVKASLKHPGLQNQTHRDGLQPPKGTVYIYKQVVNWSVSKKRVRVTATVPKGCRGTLRLRTPKGAKRLKTIRNGKAVFLLKRSDLPPGTCGILVFSGSSRNGSRIGGSTNDVCGAEGSVTAAPGVATLYSQNDLTLTTTIQWNGPGFDGFLIYRDGKKAGLGVDEGVRLGMAWGETPGLTRGKQLIVDRWIGTGNNELKGLGLRTVNIEFRWHRSLKKPTMTAAVAVMIVPNTLTGSTMLDPGVYRWPPGRNGDCSVSVSTSVSGGGTRYLAAESGTTSSGVLIEPSDTAVTFTSCGGGPERIREHE